MEDQRLFDEPTRITNDLVRDALERADDKRGYTWMDKAHSPGKPKEARYKMLVWYTEDGNFRPLVRKLQGRSMAMYSLERHGENLGKMTERDGLFDLVNLTMKRILDITTCYILIKLGGDLRTDIKNYEHTAFRYAKRDGYWTNPTVRFDQYGNVVLNILETPDPYKLGSAQRVNVKRDTRFAQETKTYPNLTT